MLSVSVSPSNVTRSSLEEMLESIRRRDEKPKDMLPALPVRPMSKARLPSARRSLPNDFKIGEGTAAGAESLMGGKKRKEGKDMGIESNGFGSNKMPKVKVVPLVESPYVSTPVNGRDDDLNLLTVESKSGGNANFVLEKEFQVWCRLPNSHWKSGKIESASIEDSLVMLLDGNVVTVPRGNILPANPDILEGVDDLIRLSFVNEPSVLHNLQSRYYDDKFYTKAGCLLVAINPFKDVQLHQNESLTRQKVTDPHVHAIAETAFTEMMRDEESQSIIVSGESGAGKTEIANIAMRYLAALGGANGMECKLLQTNRILEAFGSAKTFRNHNSSRFGKLIEIHFSTDGKLSGAKIETFLLEKSRVVQLVKGERSFHIFYQLCSGASSSLKERLNLKHPREYEYLKKSDCLTIDDVDDARRFHMLMEDLDILQISKDDQENAFAMLSAVLWLGNISFQIFDNENHVEIIADEAVTSASKLMGCSVQDLMLTLSTRRIQSGNDTIVQKLTLRQAIDTRDTLAESIYASLFDWLLGKINKSLEIDKQRAWRSISIVDIYGFESFQKNSFEQFRINYANERLQQHFKRHLFQLEQEEYTREGIDWTTVDFQDNQECIDLFEQKPYGLLSLLDEESNSAQATDLSLANKLKHHLSSEPCFKEKKDGTFSVFHYAGEVLYDTSGFLEKNRDSLHSDSIQLLSLCTHQLPQLFASNMLKPSQMPMSSFWSSSATDSQKQSVGSKLKDQLSKLMQQLENTKPHIICCIIPNNKQLPGMFDNDLVVQQLRSCGLLEVVRISRLGYPTRMTHQKFANRYGLLHPANVVSQGSLNTSVTILQHFDIHPDAYQVGYTKLFFRTGQISRLEDARERMLQCIIKVQKCFRGHLARCHFLEFAKRTIAQQSSDQAENARKESQLFTEKLRSVSPKEKRPKQHIAKETSHDRQKAIILLQSVIRGWLVRKHSRSMQNLGQSNLYIANGYTQSDESTPECKDLKQEHSEVSASAVGELQRKVLKAEGVIKQKEDENAVLQQQLKQLQIRWVEHDARMKSMEAMWQKQMTSLQMNLAAAKNSLAVDDARGQNGKPDASPLPHYYDSEDTVSAPRTPERRTPAKLLNYRSESTPSREPNESLNAVSHLVKELEQRKQVFNNDVKILVEVKSGQSVPTMYSYNDLRKVKTNFETWKKEFKVKIREAKRALKRANPESEKARKTWWGMRSSRRT